MFLKKNFIFAALIFSFCFSAFGQQITKFGVVDTAKVYQTYFRDSTPVRNYESKKSEFQTEINKLVAELQNLHDKKLEYEKSGNDAAAVRTLSQIEKKKEFLTEYTNAKNIELETMKRSLQNNDAFYKNLQGTLARVAESGGYSLILNLQESNAVLWYSNSVDITDQVISQLGR